jgi:flavodoxin
MGERQFELEILKKLYPKINLDYHNKNIPFALGLKLSILSRNLYKTIEEIGYNIMMIDHQSPILNDPDKGISSSPHNVQHSVQFTKQKNADVLYVKCDLKNTTVIIDLIYKDIKNMYQGPKKGHVAVLYGLNNSDENKRYMSQHIDSLKGLSKEEGFKGKYKLLEDLRAELEGKKKSSTPVDNAEYKDNFNKILLEISLKYKVSCTLAYSMPDDLDYLSLYLLIKQAIKENPEIINTEVLFPKGNVFNANATRDFF